MSFDFTPLSAIRSPGSWDRYPTTGMAITDDTVAIIPIYGLGDYGLGLSVDVDEVVGSAVLSSALNLLGSTTVFRPLPPVRLGLSPYHNTIGRIGPDHFLNVINEIVDGLAKSGIKNLLFWTTNPWSSEIVDTASRDIRASHSLRTYVIDAAGVGLSLHPSSKDRSRVQILASQLSQRSPSIPNTGHPVDVDFRPGNWHNLPPVETRTTDSPGAVLTQSAKLMAELLVEVANRSTINPLALNHPENREASCVYPEGRRHRYLPALSRPEIDAFPDKKDTLVVIPIGAIEQHGPHLPLGVDAMIAEAACDGLASRLPTEIWFGPTLAFGKSNEHLSFAGTVSLSAQSLRQIVKSLVLSLHAEGFRQFALLNTHGGNSSVLTYTLRELQQELKVRAGMLRLKATDELDPQERTWGFHAGEWETSVMLAIAPETVQMDRAICHYPASLDDPGMLRPENAPATHSWVTQDIAPDGVMGDATKATAEKGRRWLDAALDQLAEQIRALLQRG